MKTWGEGQGREVGDVGENTAGGANSKHQSPAAALGNSSAVKGSRVSWGGAGGGGEDREEAGDGRHQRVVSSDMV